MYFAIVLSSISSCFILGMMILQPYDSRLRVELRMVRQREHALNHVDFDVVDSFVISIFAV